MKKKILLCSCFGLLIAVRLFYIVSFPLNFGGDASIYYTMILEKHSSLLMAPGYPFLMALPFHGMKWLLSWWIRFPEDPVFTPWWQSSQIRGDLLDHPLTSDFSWIAFFQDHHLIIFQHAIVFLALICGFLLVKKHFGFYPGLLFAFLYGMSPLSLEWPSSSLPEWLQGSLVIFWIYIADRANKTSWISFFFLGAIAALAYLVKFNSLPVFLILFGGWIYWNWDRFWNGATEIAVSLAGVVFVIGGFQFSYHRPSTGISDLTLNSWPLADKVLLYAPNSSVTADLGVSAQRLLALSQSLPERETIYSPARYFQSVSANDAERVDFREKFRWMLTAKELDAKGAFYTQDPMLKVAYYIGLPEYSALLRGLYLESLWKHPFLFLHQTTVGFLYSFSVKDKSYFFHPKWEEVETGRGEAATHYGYAKFLWPKERHVCYHENGAWLPGVWFFTKQEQFWLPTWFLWFMAFLTFAFACNTWREEKSRKVIFLFTILVFFVFFSNVIWIFRLKEFECVRSLVTTLAAVGLYQVFSLARLAFRKVFYQWKMWRYAL